jgi:hypothetical protein
VINEFLRVGERIVLWKKGQKMTRAKRDLYKTRERFVENIDKELNKANKLWYGSIRLIITLSSSFLLLTLALVEKLFPQIKTTAELSGFLISAWIALFFAIIFGVITELDASIFHGNIGRKGCFQLGVIDEKIAQGLQEDEVELPERYFTNAPIIWGTAGVNSFIFAILCLCLSFLENILSRGYCFFLLGMGILVLIVLNIYLLNKREK